MQKQSSIQRKQDESIQPSQTAPIQQKEKYFIRVTAKAGVADWEQESLTEEGLSELLQEILDHGYNQRYAGRLIIFPPASIEKIEVVRV